MNGSGGGGYECVGNTEAVDVGCGSQVDSWRMRAIAMQSFEILGERERWRRLQEEPASNGGMLQREGLGICSDVDSWYRLVSLGFRRAHGYDGQAM